MPGDDGTAGVGSYLPAGTLSAIPKAYPNSPQVPLQATFPTEVPPGVLPSLAANAGTGQNTGIVSALLSEDSSGVDLESQTVPKETPYENGTTSPIVTGFVILTLFSY